MASRVERAEEMRTRLLDAAEAIIAESGLHALTIRTLAASAGTTTQPIYSYFGDKASILEAIFERALTTVADELADVLDPPQEAGGGQALALLRKGADDYRRFALENPGKFAVLFLESDELANLTAKTRSMREALLTQIFSMQSRIWPEEGPWVATMVIAALNGFINAELSGFITEEDQPDLGYERLVLQLMPTPIDR